MEKAKAKNIEELLMLLQDISIDNPHRHIHSDDKIHKVEPQGSSRGSQSGWNKKAHDDASQFTEEEAEQWARQTMGSGDIFGMGLPEAPSWATKKLREGVNSLDVVLRGSHHDDDQTLPPLMPEQERMISLVAQIARVPNTKEGVAEAKKLLAELKSLLPTHHNMKPISYDYTEDN